jgi:ABC-type dipeptide/oligopeptide/nickel transport system permease component
MLTIGKDQWDLLDRAKHIIMPAIVLALSGIAFYARLLRTETLDVIRQDYIRTAEAKGLSERVVVYVHALRNALIPVVTALGGILAALVGGALVIEQVFTWPGIGQLTFQAAVAKDYPVITAGVMLGGILLVLVPLAATGLLGLAAVVAAHELAEVLVIANGVRAGRRLPRPPTRPVPAVVGTPSRDIDAEVSLPR